MIRAVIPVPCESVRVQGHELVASFTRRATPELQTALERKELYARLGEMVVPVEVENTIVGRPDNGRDIVRGSSPLPSYFLPIAYILTARFPR